VKTLHNENGFVLVTGLLTLVVLTFLGIAATQNTTIELRIAGNDRLYQQNFYDSEAIVNLGGEIMAQNFFCPTGFTQDGATGADAGDGITAENEPALKNYADLPNNIRVYEQLAGNPPAPNNLILSRNPHPREWDPGDQSITIYKDINDKSLADAAYPVANIDTGENVGYLYMGGSTEMLPGGALQMAAGYEGKGKGSASGGVAKIMDIYSMYYGEQNSRACVVMGWRYLVDLKNPTCNY